MFIQSKKISLLLERWAEKKWIQLGFSAALACGITRAIAAGTGRQLPADILPPSLLIPQGSLSTDQRNSCGSSGFTSAGFSLLPPKQTFAGCARGEF